MDASALKTQLIPLADKADTAASARDGATALDAMTKIKDVDDPVQGTNSNLSGGDLVQA
jgi:hypothetical protein